MAALEKAGHDLVADGYVANSLIDEIAEVRLDKDQVYEMANKSWDICIDEGMTMPELQQKLANP